MGIIKRNVEKNSKFNVSDFIILLTSILLVVALLLYTIFGINKTINDKSFVQITYEREVIYYEPITDEKTPLVITREMGVTGDKENNIKPIGKNFDFVGPNVSINIVNATIQVVEEDSPRKICTRQGVVKYANVPIICDPNHLMVVIVGDSNNSGDFDN